MLRFRTFAALLGCLGTVGAWAADLPWLFEVAESKRIGATPVRARPGFHLPTTIIPRAVTTVRAGDRRRVPLPDGSSAVLVIDDCHSAEPGIAHLRGRLEGEAGSDAMLVFVDGRMAGVFRHGTGDVEVIHPVENGRHEYARRAYETLPRCGTSGQWQGGTAGLMKVEDANRMAFTPTGTEASGTTNVVDLALVYTSTAEMAAGGPAGMRALLELAVAEANDAFGRSGAQVQLRTVFRASVAYTESGDLDTDLNRLLRPDDGFLDEVMRLRDGHAADVVCLVVEFEDTNQFAGKANQLTSTDRVQLERGFAVCLRPYLLGNYTLPHEMGHVLGCNHDAENSSADGLHTWSHGTRIQVGDKSYRTVMAYRPGLQFPHFSNPRVLFQGVPTGIEGIADNVRTLNLASPLVARVREPRGRIGFVHSAVTVEEEAGSVRLQILRTGDLTATSLQVTALPSSAREGIDYELEESRLNLPAGLAEAHVGLRVFDNSMADGPRRLTVVLSDPGAGMAIGPIGELAVTLADDESQAVAVLDTSFRTRPGADHEVRSLAVLPDGDVIVGGSFATFNGAPHARLAVVHSNGSENGTVASQIKYRVNATVVLSDGRLALGGEFNTVDGERRNHVAVLQFNGQLDPSFLFDIGTDYPVHAMADWPPGGLAMGGSFTTVHAMPALRVARLLLDGSLDRTFDTRAGPDADVLAVAIDAEGRTLVGGRFRNVGSRARGGLARLNSRGELDAGFAAGAGADGAVYALAPDRQGRILVAGDFTRFDGEPAGRVLRVLSDGRRDPEFNAGQGADDAVLALLVAEDGGIWIAGRFTHVDARPRNRIARLLADGLLDEAFDPGIGPNDWVRALAPWHGDGVLIGGVFNEVNGVPRGGVAALFGRLPPPPRFGRATAVPGGLKWDAWVWPRQAYELQRSSNLRQWLNQEEVSGADGWTEGVLLSDPAGSGFLRLHRRLE